MLTIFQFLLRLYPAGYLREYAGEMSWVFEQRLREIEHLGSRERMSFAAHEIAGLVGGALRQRNSFRRFNMPLFRFPRSTVFMMLAALAGLFTTIHMGASILMESSRIQPVAWYAVPGVFATMFLMFFIVAAVGNAILHAMNQSGSQRLKNMRPWQERSRGTR